MLIRKATVELVITNRRIIYKKGWIARKTEEMSLRRIEEVNVKQGIGGRIFNYGKVRISGTGSGKINFPTVAQPLSFKKSIQEAQAHAEGDS